MHWFVLCIARSMIQILLLASYLIFFCKSSKDNHIRIKLTTKAAFHIACLGILLLTLLLPYFSFISWSTHCLHWCIENIWNFYNFCGIIFGILLFSFNVTVFHESRVFCFTEYLSWLQRYSDASVWISQILFARFWDVVLKAQCFARRIVV